MREFIHPGCLPRAEGVRVYVGETEVEVLRTRETMFVCARVNAPAVARVVAETDLGEVALLPSRHGLAASPACREPGNSGAPDGRAVSFPVEPGRHVLTRIQNQPLPLFFYALPPETPDTRATYHFKAGQSYEVGELRLRDNESVYIEHGAVLRGRIVAEHARGIKIGGQGILDNSWYKLRGERVRSIYLFDCKDVVIEDILMVNPTSWMVHLAGCENVHVRRLREIGECVGSDGVDVVGSRNVLIEDCFFRNNDDCVVVKHMPPNRDAALEKFMKPVRGVMARHCAFFNAGAGNVIEIGHELVCDEVSGIVFRDIDVLRKDGNGAVFSIHAGDQALVRDVLFEDIRVEHYWDKLVD
ncbi:MAG: glycosyl hydrolase family 28 protein, partial [Kiritimatiellaeota bacterium]|nr:glycosyl hydrolase family 28 protein [Kiritimatiellota bacterium]